MHIIKGKYLVAFLTFNIINSVHRVVQFRLKRSNLLIYIYI